MKKMKKAVLSSLMLILLLISACKKDEPDQQQSTPYKCASCAQTSEAKPTFDNNSGGVYKGVLVGSSGTIALYLYNTDSVIQALVAFDGTKATLQCSSLKNWKPGDAISNALFTGTINGKTINALFSVDAHGQNPTVDVQIPGHDVTVAVYKETSSLVIRNFEGTYTGDDNGIFNMVFSGNDFSIVTDGGDVFESTLVNNELDYNTNGIIVKGQFKGTDELSGTWKNTNTNEQGTWSGKRTL